MIHFLDLSKNVPRRARTNIDRCLLEKFTFFFKAKLIEVKLMRVLLLFRNEKNTNQSGSAKLQ